MPIKVPFEQIDVFTQTNFKGNPVAVVMDGNSLTTEQMQQIANWINLSETTFVCTPKNPLADYQLRIFTPQNELPFAGHPTIGSAYAVLKNNINRQNDDYLVQECKSGLIKIYIEDDKLFLTMPEPTIDYLHSDLINQFSQALGITPQDIKIAAKINVGAIWYTLQLQNDKQVIDLNPDMAELAKIVNHSASGVTVFGQCDKTQQSDFEVRSFAPSEGANEDPVCGSGNGCVAVLVKQHNLIDSDEYLVSQGQCLSREGYVHVKIPENDAILIGGNAVSCITGQLSI